MKVRLDTIILNFFCTIEVLLLQYILDRLNCIKIKVRSDSNLKNYYFFLKIRNLYLYKESTVYLTQAGVLREASRFKN